MDENEEYNRLLQIVNSVHGCDMRVEIEKENQMLDRDITFPENTEGLRKVLVNIGKNAGDCLSCIRRDNSVKECTGGEQCNGRTILTGR